MFPEPYGYAMSGHVGGSIPAPKGCGLFEASKTIVRGKDDARPPYHSGIGHNATAMFGSPNGMQELFD